MAYRHRPQYPEDGSQGRCFRSWSFRNWEGKPSCECANGRPKNLACRPHVCKAHFSALRDLAICIGGLYALGNLISSRSYSLCRETNGSSNLRVVRNVSFRQDCASELASSVGVSLQSGLHCARARFYFASAGDIDHRRDCLVLGDFTKLTPEPRTVSARLNGHSAMQIQVRIWRDSLSANLALYGVPHRTRTLDRLGSGDGGHDGTPQSESRTTA
jgi:hypothetical protein